jgi:hypothetical protein
MQDGVFRPKTALKLMLLGLRKIVGEVVAVASLENSALPTLFSARAIGVRRVGGQAGIAVTGAAGGFVHEKNIRAAANPALDAELRFVVGIIIPRQIDLRAGSGRSLQVARRSRRAQRRRATLIGKAGIAGVVKSPDAVAIRRVGAEAGARERSHIRAHRPNLRKSPAGAGLALDAVAGLIRDIAPGEVDLCIRNSRGLQISGRRGEAVVSWLPKWYK